jgi:hypothetical protein
MLPPPLENRVALLQITPDYAESFDGTQDKFQRSICFSNGLQKADSSAEFILSLVEGPQNDILTRSLTGDWGEKEN